jgi:hypothetical protein
VVDSFITDNYQANYLWYINLRYEFQSKVNFQLTFEQHLQKVCNIQSSWKNYWAVAPAHQKSNLNSNTIALSSLQGIMNILALLSVLLSAIYLMILTYETIQNIRLVCFTSDVLSYNPFLNPQESKKYQKEIPEHVSYFTKCKQSFLEIISFLVRKVFMIPPRFYLNDFPSLYQLLSSDIFLASNARNNEEDEEEEPAAVVTPREGEDSQSSGSSSQQEINKVPIYSKNKSKNNKLSFSEMKDMYSLTNELFHFAPSDLYNYPKEKTKTESVQTNIPLEDMRKKYQEAGLYEKENNSQQQQSKLRESETTKDTKEEQEKREKHEQKIQLFQRKQIEVWQKLSFKVKVSFYSCNIT